MSFHKSIKFSQKNHDEISDLLDYHKLQEDKKLKYREKFDEFFLTFNSSKFLYIIEDDYDSNYKIGITNNLNTRIKQLQTGNPSQLEFVAYFHSDIIDSLGLEIKYLEKFLHYNYRGKRIKGEWFNLETLEVVDICIFLDFRRGLNTEFCGIGYELEEYNKRLEEINKYNEDGT